jgi:hypothetical protein
MPAARSGRVERPPAVAAAALPPWWLRAGAIVSVPLATPLARRCYRLGNAVLDLESDISFLTRALDDHYGECIVAPSEVEHLAHVRCSVRLVEADRLAIVRFSEPELGALEIALSLLKHPAAAPLYVERQTAIAGWHLVEETATGTPVVAARDSCAVLDCNRLPLRALTQWLINPVLGTQRELLFAHAASIGMKGAGIMLIGPSHCGKTTTALTRAARGHAYFGDDVAAIRTASPELLAFWRTAHIRPGPHARALAHHVASGKWDPPYADGMPRLRLRVAELFPQTEASCVPLRLALFLRGFAAEPRLEVFTPMLETFGASSRFALNNTLWVAWGTTPHRRLLQFVLFVRMLSRVRCAWLDVGDPEPTADLIERTMEDLWA